MNKDQKHERQLTLRSVLIGAVGSVIITMSSMFIALKLSSLPWPIIFVALASMFSLKAFGNTNMGEINVTHTAMSAGAMVAGGLAFTIPGIWMIMPDQKPDLLMLMTVSVGGTLLGLAFTAMIRRYFIDEKDLEYPMGQAAADTLTAGDEGGAKARFLFITMGITAVFTVLRDVFAKIPATLMSKKMAAFGASTGLYISPMLVGVGYLLGPVLIGIWTLGAVIGDFGILLAGQTVFGLDAAEAASIKQSLGIGLMVGCGIGIFIKMIIPRIKQIVSAYFGKREETDILGYKPIAVIIVLAFFAFTYICRLGFIASVITVAGAWLATSMSSECVGRTGINPMEIFGITVLLIVKAVTSVGGVEGFYVAAIVAVAAGLTGDVMNDFKAGAILKTDPEAQWVGEAVGGLIGAVVAVATLFIIYRAYGSEAIGGTEFPAAQAAAVASMVSGISNVPAFITGIIAAAVLYVLNVPVMTFGLGVYLPSFMSFTAAIGGLISFITHKTGRAEAIDEKMNLLASGMLGGEAVVGVIIAIVLAIQSI